MKLLITSIVRAVLGFFLARRDLSKKIRLKAKNDQLSEENKILDMQNNNRIADVNAADSLFKRLSKRKK